jgi:hypothetical protein
MNRAFIYPPGGGVVRSPWSLATDLARRRLVGYVPAIRGMPCADVNWSTIGGRQHQPVAALLERAEQLVGTLERRRLTDQRHVLVAFGRPGCCLRLACGGWLSGRRVPQLYQAPSV